jgi:hypothetical protein
MYNNKNRNKMTNLIKWDVRPQTERETVGTLAEIGGKGTELLFISSNLANPDRRLMVVLKRPDGKSTTILCSPKVGELVRAKKITKAQLAGFPVIEHTVGEGYDNAGLVMPLISMPDGGGLISTGTIDEVEEYTVATIDPSELIAF